MKIFRCPHCSVEYEILLVNVSFRQRSYAKCQQCWKTMYSWNSCRVPRFTELTRGKKSRAELTRRP